MAVPPRIAILVGSKGRGSNMANIISACQSGRIGAEAALVISSRDGTPAVLRAQSHGIKTLVLKPSSATYSEELLQALRREEINLVCLAGYMTLLPLAVVEEFAGRLLNIHPALLPKYGGKGMYGIHVHEAVIAAGETESGCSVHWVTENYDEGAVLHQVTCEVKPDDTPETLACRVMECEERAYPEAIVMALEGLQS